MKILVTGCAGFIGFHLIQKLLAQRYEVVGVDNINSYYSTDLKYSRLRMLGINAEKNSSLPIRNGNFVFIKANIEDKELFKDILKDLDFDIVCHLAAQAGVRYSIECPQDYISANIQGFFNVLEYCRCNPAIKLVYASSSSVYGKNSKIPYKEDDITDSPVSLYAATKKSNELMAHAYSALYGFETIGLRFFTVYGPWGRPDMAPFLFTKAILESEPIKVFNNGDMFRDFTYIDDIVEGIYRVLISQPDTELKSRVYNIGNSTPINLEHFISIIENISGKAATRIYMPMQPGDVKATWADTSMLRRDYGYAPATPLETGLEAFIDWYKEYYYDQLDEALQPEVSFYM